MARIAEQIIPVTEHLYRSVIRDGKVVSRSPISFMVRIEGDPRWHPMTAEEVSEFMPEGVLLHNPGSDRREREQAYLAQHAKPMEAQEEAPRRTWGRTRKQT